MAQPNLSSLALIVTVLLWLQAGCLFAKPREGGFGGIEFFGSSLISRIDLEKELSLKQGSSYESTMKAADRLKARLQRHNLQAEVGVVKDGDKCFITVDVIEPGATGIPLRKLPSPHHVYLTSDLPFTLLQQLYERIEQLSLQGRADGQHVVDGIKQFQDEPCNQLAKKLLQVVPLMQAELWECIENDPDPSRRSRAVECLNWDTQPVRDCLALIPIIDDGAEAVRVSTARYISARISMLPDNFPMAALIEGFAHELSRPSHTDRLLALGCLTQIVRTHPFTGRAVKEAVGEKVQQLASQTLLSSIKQPAEQLLQLASHAPPLPRARTPVHINEF